MQRRNRPSIKKPHSNHVHRWTVSYADYMTLMFALFVVLYAVLLNKSDDYEEIIDAIQSSGNFIHNQPFDSIESDLSNSTIVAQEKDTKDGITVNNIPAVRKEGLVPGNNSIINDYSVESELSDIESNNDGASLASLKLSLESALISELASGDFSVNLDGDWLTIEMSGPLLFAAKSHTLLNGAKRNINYIAEVLKPVNNLIRLRGYTDTHSISDEIYKTNWELSALRAVSVLHALNEDGVSGARMAIEGFGQYHPILDANGNIDNFKSRRVVIAISRFALFVDKKPDNNINVKTEEEKSLSIPKPDSEEVREIYLPDGRLIITTRQESP